MTLAEIIAEGERLDREAVAAAGTGGIAAYTAAAFYITHGRTLLAVCKAAVEWDEAEREYLETQEPITIQRLTEAEGGLRLAVRGDAAKGDDRG